MIERLLILLMVLAAALAVVAWRERRRSGHVSARGGITVFTGPDCRICPALLASLDGAGARYREVDVSVEAVPGVRSLPTVIVAATDGTVRLRRSGRAAVTDLGAILAAASQLDPIGESA